MSLEGTLAAVIMLIAGVVWLALPIMRRRYFPSVEELKRRKDRDALLTTYERTLASLRDVNEDHLTGKLSNQDYEAERTYWTDQGVAVLEALENAGGALPTRQRRNSTQPAVQPPLDADAALDDAIEQTIASYIKSMQ
ncbi:MAG: hypothetical protein GC204_18345 [Chloroflexi bacterium]|nr:hypothetical protein [Chloroflexota bacterium]